jgi:hypothetical protein
MQPNDDNVHVKRQDHELSRLATRSVRPVLATILLIAFAELFMFSGMRREAIILHTFVLIAVSISTVSQKDKCVAWALQALMLLPLLRLVNFSMPVFSEMVLYRYFYVYIPLFIPIFLIIRHQSFSLVQLGLSSRSLFFYLPLSLVIGLLIAESGVLYCSCCSSCAKHVVHNMVDIVLIMSFVLVGEGSCQFSYPPDLKAFLVTQWDLLLQGLLFGVMSSAYGTGSGVLLLTGRSYTRLYVHLKLEACLCCTYPWSCHVFFSASYPFRPGLNTLINGYLLSPYYNII